MAAAIAMPEPPPGLSWRAQRHATRVRVRSRMAHLEGPTDTAATSPEPKHPNPMTTRQDNELIATGVARATRPFGAC
jgi:hypothetical protein